MAWPRPAHEAAAVDGPVLSAAKVELARKLRDGGEHTMAQIAELVGCSRATLYRVLNGAEQGSA